jgi:hypothetical protein
MSAFARLGIIALDNSAIRPAKSAGRWSIMSALSMLARSSNENGIVPADEARDSRESKRQRTRQTSR